MYCTLCVLQFFPHFHIDGMALGSPHRGLLVAVFSLRWGIAVLHWSLPFEGLGVIVGPRGHLVFRVSFKGLIVDPWQYLALRIKGGTGHGIKEVRRWLTFFLQTKAYHMMIMSWYSPTPRLVGIHVITGWMWEGGASGRCGRSRTCPTTPGVV